ncbi:MAG TPA: cation diffusion facilitator family transporter [bacterium]|jgi:cation diffusion facilitator family transporter|nr:cation diffusion facilitator family transporter [bacterium]
MRDISLSRVFRAPQVRAAVVSVVAGLGILVFKFTAYLLTGSVSILSDAAESVVNVIASNVALISLVVAVRPPDQDHPYGHEKAEYISGFTEGGLVILAGLYVVYAAVQRLVNPVPLRNLDAGLVVLAVATAANYFTARFLLRVSREAESMALESDARHLLADVITTVAVFVGLGLVWFTGVTWLDPLVGILVGLHILGMGTGVYRRALGGLMDTSLPPPEEAAIKGILDAHKNDIVEYHAFRARKAGSRRFIDLHLVLHRTMTVGQSHALTDHLEEHIEAELPRTDITIHVEPCGPTCPRCAAIEAATPST